MYVFSCFRFVRACSFFSTPRTRMTRPHFQGTQELSMSRSRKSLPYSLSRSTMETETPWPTCRPRGYQDIMACPLSDLHPSYLLSYLYEARVSRSDSFLYLNTPKQTFTEQLITFVHVRAVHFLDSTLACTILL